MSGHREEMPEKLSDVESGELARRAHSGCALAFEELARRFRPRLVLALSRRLNGNRADAEDVTQETFARAWQKIGLFDLQYHFSTWLYTIAFRLATDHRRREKHNRRNVVLCDTAETPAPDGDAVAAAARADEVQNIWRHAKDALSAQQYDVLWLRYGEDRSVPGIAKALGRTRTGVRVTLHRARKALQRHLTMVSESSGEQDS